MSAILMEKQRQKREADFERYLSEAMGDLDLNTEDKVGFYTKTPIAQQTSGADLTNNVTAGGTTDQIDDITSLTVYATDAAAIRNAIYQLARKLKQLNDGLRIYGYFS